MSELRTLMTGIGLGESPRWHEGRLWFSDWVAEEVIALDLIAYSDSPAASRASASLAKWRNRTHFFWRHSENCQTVCSMVAPLPMPCPRTRNRATVTPPR